MKTELIAVLDVDSRHEALARVGMCGDCKWFKVGLQLFARCGPDIVRELVGMGKHVMLDLKLHDIPNTVRNAARAAAELGASLVTVHAFGGRRMIAAATEAVEGHATRVLAVTVLTSLSDAMLRDELGLPATAAETVHRLAAVAVASGAHGVVASPREIGTVRRAVGSEPLIVTPGVRPVWASQDDQTRVMTPRQAAEAGADFVVVGRPIFNHPNPAEAVQRIREDLGL